MLVEDVNRRLFQSPWSLCSALCRRSFGSHLCYAMRLPQPVLCAIIAPCWIVVGGVVSSALARDNGQWENSHSVRGRRDAGACLLRADHS
jgi:hypothetical protein